jgi:hypothetical protein
MLLRWTARLLVATAVVTVVAGCAAVEPTAGPGQTPVADSATATPATTGSHRTAAVYAAAIRYHLTTVTEPMPPVVYVLARAIPGAANAMRTVDDESGEAIDQQVQDQLVRELADLAVVTFVASTRTVVAADRSCPKVNDHGAMLTLAPVPLSGDRVELGLADFRGCLNGRWQTYVLARTTTGWTVQGTTGSVSIS